MNNSPRISVILPTKDRPEVVDRSIQSVLNQTFSDFELLIIDSSLDTLTRSKVKQYDDNRITYLTQKPKGLSAARNLGLDAARGEFIAFQDDDDEWHQKKLEKQLERFEVSDEHVSVVYTKLRKVRGDTTWDVPQNELSIKRGDIRSSLQYHNFISPQAVVARAQCFDEVGQFDETIPALEDYEMWIRLSKCYEFDYISGVHVTAYLSSDSLSRDFESVAAGRDKIVRKHSDYFDEEAAAEQFFWSGHGFLKTGQTERGRVNLKKAIDKNFRGQYLGAYLLSLFGSNVYLRLYRLFKSILGHSKRV